MPQTKITKMLSIRYPIIVGTMVHLSRAEFIGAISEARGTYFNLSSLFKN